MPGPVTTFAYDSVAYPSLTHPQSHPASLAPKALLFGLSPAPPDRCRVLELGCGDGLNLAAMSLAHPNSTYIGLDLSTNAIARGREMLRATGLRSVELREGNINDVDASWGEFDYIIAHGVYSWVPPEVRESVLRVAGSLLAPDGLAFVSYLALPGAHIREMVRSLTRFHTSAMRDPEVKAREAISLIGFLGRASTENAAYHQLMQSEFELLRNRGTETVYHDELSEISAPVYFHDFCREAGRHGLEFLSDAEYVEPPAYGLTDEARDMLKPLAVNRVLLEQYLDFVHGRRFRQTLLCRSGRNPALQRERLQALHLSCEARPVDAPTDLNTAEVLTFQGKKRAAFRCEHPLTKAVLCELAAIYPERRTYPDALAAGARRLGATEIASSDDDRLRSFITRLYAPSLVEIHFGPLPFPSSTGERPIASPLARWMLRQDIEHVISLRGSYVEIEGRLGRFLVGLLDGTRNRANLLTELKAMLREAAAADGKQEDDQQKLPSADAPDLEAQLDRA
jgi:SAM-dependent methyltransferase